MATKPLISNVSYEQMQLSMDLTSETRGGVAILEPIDNSVDAKALSVLSLTSCLNLVSGPISLYKGIQKINLAQKLKDGWGIVRGALDTVSGSLQTASGFAYAPASGMLLALLFTTSKTLEVASSILGAIGGGLLGVASAFRLIKICIGFGSALSVRHSLNSTTSAKLSMNSNVHEWRRIVGSELMEKLEKANPIEEITVLQEIKSHANREIGMQIIEAALTVTIIALAILSFFFTGGTSALILAIAGSLVGVSYLLLDLSAFRETLKSEIGKMDKVLVWTVALLTSALLGLSLALARTPLGIAITAVSAFVITTLNVATLAAVHKKPQLS